MITIKELTLADYIAYCRNFNPVSHAVKDLTHHVIPTMYDMRHDLLKRAFFERRKNKMLSKMCRENAILAKLAIATAKEKINFANK